MIETRRPYAAQTWAAGVLDHTNMMPGAALQIIGRDLVADAQEHGVTEGVIELWANEATGTKGFFVGDTSSLPGEGWTWAATL